MLVAASLALNQAGEGSSPSGPTDNKHWSSSGQDSAPVMRLRRFESGVASLARQRRRLSLFDNLVVFTSAHDVTAACCLARAEERVQFPLGAHSSACGRDGKSTCFGSTKMLVRLQPRRLIIAVGPVLVRVGDC